MVGHAPHTIYITSIALNCLLSFFIYFLFISFLLYLNLVILFYFIFCYFDRLLCAEVTKTAKSAN